MLLQMLMAEKWGIAMKRREKLLRLRPFNMANFSSGAGMLVIWGILFSCMFILLPMFFLWAGFALPMKMEEGEMNYHVLVRRLNHMLLPICLVFFCLFFWGVLGMIPENDGRLLLSLWVASFPTLGIFFAARISATRLYNSETKYLTKGNWFKYLLVAALLLIVIGALGSLVSVILGYLLGTIGSIILILILGVTLWLIKKRTRQS